MLTAGDARDRVHDTNRKRSIAVKAAIGLMKDSSFFTERGRDSDIALDGKVMVAEKDERQ